MDDEIIEGEVIEPEMIPDLDTRIAAEVEDFQQRMDQMKDVYLFAADHIRHSYYQPQSTSRPPQGPHIGYIAVRTCGRALVTVGNWLIEKYPSNEEPPASDDEAGVKWEWSHETGLKRPVTLPPPNLSRFGGS